MVSVESRPIHSQFDQIVDLIFEMSKNRFRREIEIIEICMVDETMAIVSAMLTGDKFVFLFLGVVIGICHA